MRTEAEIREAMELIAAQKIAQNNPLGVATKDATVEALRYVLGIDDQTTTPMSEPLANIIGYIKNEENEESTTVTE